MTVSTGTSSHILAACSCSSFSFVKYSTNKTTFGTTRRCGGSAGFLKTAIKAQQRATWLPGLDPPPYLDGTLAVEYIINHAEISLVFVQESKLPAILSCVPNCSSNLKTIVSFGKVSESQKKEAMEQGVDCFSWEEFTSMGKLDDELPAKHKTDICTIMYTSGTTGEPKGVILSLLPPTSLSLVHLRWNQAPQLRSPLAVLVSPPPPGLHQTRSRSSSPLPPIGGVSMVEVISIVLIAVITTTLLLVRILYVISRSSKPIHNTSKHLSTLVVLGSGGHTAEMINLLSVMQNNLFAPRFYIAAATDNMSLQKARVFENSLDDKGADSTQFMQIYRSREVGQSYITSIGTTLYALWLMLKIRPQVILCNGPGTCIPICAITFIFKVLGIRWSNIFYVESIARVKRLSLSGLLLYKLHMADQLFVQWPQLQKQ